MPAADLRVVVCYQPLADVVDVAAFSARFPGVALSTVDYDIAHEELVIRGTRPSEAAPDDLTDQQRADFASADVLVGLNMPLRLADTAPNVTWVQGIGSGIGQFVASGVDHVVVTNAAGVGAPPIAEWVLAQLLAIYKRLAVHLDQQRQHLWKAAGGSLLMGRRALVVGTGAIGTAVATRLDALGVQVIGVRRRVIDGEPLPAGITEMYPADRLLEAASTAHVVVAAVPGSPATADMFDQPFFHAMRSGSVFVNVGRGVSVDEVALIRALESGHLRAAAIDVAKHEPLPGDDPLWDAPNLFISPHSSGAGGGYMARMWDLFCDNLERFRSGQPLQNVVDVHAEYG